MQRRPLQSSSNSSKTSRLAKYWSKHPQRFSFPFNSRKFFAEWKQTKGELNVASFLKAFDFGYLEFGRWVKQDEREARFAGLAESCFILSSNLFFDSSNLGCDRHINLAIGARGVGGKALAHFEPTAMVINTTKTGGNHSFAHEYAHALDYFLGMHYDQNKKFDYLSGGRADLSLLKDNTGGNLRKLTVMIVEEAAKQFEKVLGKAKFEEYRKGKYEYWYRPNEIFARSFEAWLAFTFYYMDEGKSYNYSNSFLCKPMSKYKEYPMYYPRWWKKLDDYFLAWCALVGKAMNDIAASKLPSISTVLKTAQSRHSKSAKKTKVEKPAKPKAAKAKPSTTTKKKTSTRKTKSASDLTPPRINKNK